MKPVVFVIIDGAADSGIKTPLSEAKKPNIDFLSSGGFCGLWRGADAPKWYNPKSMSDVATLELLGYSYSDNPGRGYLEALGLGIKKNKNAIYLRGNFATAKQSAKGIEIIDRRAGRDETGLKGFAKKLCIKIEDVKITCIHSVGHRCVLILEGPGLGKDVSDADSGTLIKTIESKKGSEKTARILNKFSIRAFEILSEQPLNKKRKMAANYVLLRGASKYKKIQTFNEKFNFRACSISGVGIIWGISRYLGIDYFHPKGVTGHLNTNLKSKINETKKAMKKYNFIILHINGCDEAGHDMNFDAKKKFIEKIDKEVISELLDLNINLVITSDHQTSVISGKHQFGPVPFLLHDNEKNISNGITIFSESSCAKARKYDSIIKEMREKFGC